MKAYFGDIVSSKDKKTLSEKKKSFILVDDDGIIVDIADKLPTEYENVEVKTFEEGSVIIPAFSDMHVHAPQYEMRGLGMDALLSDWLSTYTFPEEAKFADKLYAEKVYTDFVDDMVKNGTLHASVYATIHRESTEILLNKMEKSGMRGFVGKVCMDVNSPDYLCEDTKTSLKETEKYLEKHVSGNVKPILTPRFAPTCSAELLAGLGKLAKKYNVPMQTHLVESKWEAAEALRLFPNCKSDSEIYERAGLLDCPTAILGHVIFPTKNDIEIIKKYNALCVHCPDATTNVIAGIAPVGALLDRDVHFAIGTDVGAGQALPVYRQISRAVQLSKLKEFYEESNRTLTFPESFYMATAEAGSLFGKIGKIEKGYLFDAIVVRENKNLAPTARIERFCYTGDDRNITFKFAGGKLI